MKKRLSLFFIVLCLLIQPTSVLATETSDGSISFPQKATYTSGLFQDVPSGAWYESGIKFTYELGLMNGTGAGSFDPDGNISIAETLALATRIHRIYQTGNGDFEQGDPWYQPYVVYAIEQHIIWPGQFSDYTAPATRTEFAIILAAALPDEAWTPINHVEQLPDVAPTDSFAADILKLYNAGVLTGSDSYGSFFPLNCIERKEVATITSRMVVPSQRKLFTLVQKPVEAESITLTGPDTVYTWDSITLIPQIFPTNTTDMTVTWNCSNWSVASVSPEGVVTGTQPGTAIITATTTNRKVAEKNVTVVKLPSISAPDPILRYSGKISDSSMLFKDKSGFGFFTNSADGVEVSWSAQNLSGKVINYYTCYFTMYNPVGDPARDSITGSATASIKTVGPVAIGDSLICGGIIGYTGVCSKVVLDKIYLEYADGSNETVYYGYSGNETLWDKYNNNWLRY